MKSLYSYIACVVLIAYVALIFNPKWNNEAGESSLGWDASTYYWYLPSIFIYKDLKQQKFGDSIIAKYRFNPRFEQSYVHTSGNRVITYSSGIALMQLPAFAVAQVLAKPLGYEADGFSKPYQVAVQVWGLLWTIIGLWFFRKLFLFYFSDKVTAIMLLLLVFGTNYLNYAALDVTLTHSWLFTFYVFLLLNIRYFYLQPSCKYAAKIGLLTGLLILIRPSELVAVLIPLLWGMESVSITAIKAHLAFLNRHYRYLLVAIGCTLLVGSVQVVYWLYVTGQPLVYSYDDKGFSWLSPHFWLYTFSYRSGWLVYTPLLIFSFIGLIPFMRTGKNKVAITCFFLLNYYIVCAWDVWWYGGTGGRAMMQSYPILLFPFAVLVQWLFQTRWLKWPVFVIMGIFVYVNIWFTYNAHSDKGLYDPGGGMTKAYFWAVIGRFKVPEHTVRYKDTDEYFEGKPKNMKLIYKYGFEDDSTADINHSISGQRSLYFDGSKEYGPKRRIPYQQGQADWIRGKVRVHFYDWEWEGWKMVQFIIGFKYQNEDFVKTRMVRLNHATSDWEAQVYFDIKVPEQRFDSLDVLFWNPGSVMPLAIDDLELWSFDE